MKGYEKLEGYNAITFYEGLITNINTRIVNKTIRCQKLMYNLVFSQDDRITSS